MSNTHNSLDGHAVVDMDPSFRIHPKTRMIVNPSGQQKTLIQGDHRSERFTFEIPRYIEGHDMLNCNDVKIHYKNTDGKASHTIIGEYVVEDLKHYEFINDILFCSWLIDGDATTYAGTLSFMFRFMCMNGETVEYAWHTADNTEDVIVVASLAPSYLTIETE